MKTNINIPVHKIEKKLTALFLLETGDKCVIFFTQKQELFVL